MSLNSFIKRRFYLRCSYYLLANATSAFRLSLGNGDADAGYRQSKMTTEESLVFVDHVFNDIYKRYSGVEHFYGKVAEVGPGDSSAIGLMFLANGCDHVDLVDRFHSKRDLSRLKAVYTRIIEDHPQLKDRVVNEDFDDTSFRGIARYYGPSADAETFFSNHTGYDFIVSAAVMEHTYDPERALAAMADALNPGGMLIHAVDLRDHRMFTPQFHELKVLEVPNPIYNLMTRGLGWPNRVRIDSYRKVVLNQGLELQMLISSMVGAQEEVGFEPSVPYENIPVEIRQAAITLVRAARHRFTAKLRNVSDEDLGISGFVLVARKPGQTTDSASRSQAQPRTGTRQQDLSAALRIY